MSDSKKSSAGSAAQLKYASFGKNATLCKSYSEFVLAYERALAKAGFPHPPEKHLKYVAIWMAQFIDKGFSFAESMKSIPADLFLDFLLFANKKDRESGPSGVSA